MRKSHMPARVPCALSSDSIRPPTGCRPRGHITRRRTRTTPPGRSEPLRRTRSASGGGTLSFASTPYFCVRSTDGRARSVGRSPSASVSAPFRALGSPRRQAGEPVKLTTRRPASWQVSTTSNRTHCDSVLTIGSDTHHTIRPAARRRRDMTYIAQRRARHADLEALRRR